MPKGYHLPRVDKLCGNCGKTFSCVASDKDRKFCSNKCKLLGCAPVPVYKKCVVCDEQFKSRRKSQTCCSVVCRGRRRAEIRHNLAKGEYSRAQKFIRLRDTGKCGRCGWKEVPEVLEFHHIDRNRKNNDPENLELLCPNCHAVEHFRAKDGQFKNNLGRVSVHASH